MTTGGPKRCLMCGNPIKAEAVRVCADCKRPIGLHDKWVWAERHGLSTCVHRHCDYPESYVRPEGSE
jgi:hypothetical protein